jgi:hypothetical protein
MIDSVADLTTPTTAGAKHRRGAITSARLPSRSWLLILAAVVGSILLFGLKGRVAEAPKADEPEVYALLLVAKPDLRILGEKADRSAVSDSEFDSYLRNQMVMLKSHLVFNRALKKPEITKLPSVKGIHDPIAWLDKSLDVTVVEKTGFLRVSLRGANLEDDAVVVNAVADAYLEALPEEEHKQQSERLMLLREIGDRLEKNLDAKQMYLRNLAKAKNSNEELSNLRMELLKEDLGIYRKEMRRVKLARAAAEIKARQEAKKAASGDRKEVQKGEKPEDRAQHKEEVEFLEEQYKQLNSELLTLEKEADELAAAFADHRSSPPQDLTITEEILRRVKTAVAELEMEMMNKTPRVRVWQPAEAPVKVK